MVINPSKYPLIFVNDAILGENTSVKISRNSIQSPNTLYLNGTVNKPVTIEFPTDNLKRYFDAKLTQLLEDRKIYLKTDFVVDKLKTTDSLVTEIKHPISIAVNDILKNSDNMIAETVLKLASAKVNNSTGTDIEGIRIFHSYCKKLGLDDSRIKIVDASGVSKNNLVNTDFITDFLIKNENNFTLQNMAQPGEGTLTHRLIPIKDRLRAKTGTLSDISSIAGYLESKSGKKYVFCIIINDPISTSSDKKFLEDYIIRELYLRG